MTRRFTYSHVLLQDTAIFKQAKFNEQVAIKTQNDYFTGEELH